MIVLKKPLSVKGDELKELCELIWDVRVASFKNEGAVWIQQDKTMIMVGKYDSTSDDVFVRITSCGFSVESTSRMTSPQKMQAWMFPRLLKLGAVVFGPEHA